MKIALIAPIEEKVPPRKYGGIEAVVYTLAEELHQLGHHVTVFASGDSRLSCRVIPTVPKAIGSSMKKRVREARTYHALTKVVRHIRREKFDIIHNHIGWQALLFQELLPMSMVTTMHWTLEDECEAEMYQQFKHLPHVSISNNQRAPVPNMNYVDTIYHGLELERFDFNTEPGKYLAFLGRFSPVKGPVEAIEIAKRSGEKLVMAGKINEFERDFFEREVKPHIDGEQISYIGEVGHKAKVKLLKNAKALLSPIKWSEPFGLVNIEAMACGTPVIGSHRGSLPELITHGTTGFLAKTPAKMASYVGKLNTISRKACRKHVETHFSSRRMVKQHLELYERMMNQRSTILNTSLLNSQT